MATTTFNDLITFSRGSNATVTGPNGLIQWAPSNLLTNSESFEAAAWTKSDATIFANQDFANGALGPELVTNGDFSSGTTTGWTAGTNVTLSVVDGDLRIQRGAAINQNNSTPVTTVAGRTYQISWQYKGRSPGSNQFTDFRVGTTIGGVDLFRQQDSSASEFLQQTYTGYFIAAGASTFVTIVLRDGVSGDWVQVDNISVKEVTPAAATAPDGTQTADTASPAGPTPIVRQTFTTSAAGAYTASVWLKSASNTNVTISLRPTGAGSPVSVVCAVTPTWQRFTVNLTAVTGVTNIQFWIEQFTQAILVWGAQLELGSTATTYNNTSVRNLLGFSEAFDNATWTKTNSSIVTGAQANPINGLFNAQKLMEDTASSGHQVNQTVTTTANPFTFSAYLKPAGRNWVALALTDSGSTLRVSYFDLANGVTGTVATGITASIVPVGSGWYRCAVTVASAVAGNNTIRVYLSDANNNTTYTGNGNSGVYIYGAQLSNSASLDPYVPTPGAAPSSTAYYGPRFDYDPVTLLPRGLLVEEARTNSLTYSEQFNDASWAKVRSTTAANSTVAPDGTTSADTLVEDTTASATHQMNKIFTGTAVAHTFSVYVKAAGRTQVRLVLFDGTTFPNQTYFDLTSATVLSGTGGTITAVGNGWYRCAIAATLTTSTNCQAQLQLAVGGTNTYTGDGTSGAFLWGAQLEAGAFATSYIPTIASTVTRSADFATITGSLFSQWYNQPEGSFIADYTMIGVGVVGVTQEILNADDATANNNFFVRTTSSLNTSMTAVTGGVAQGFIDIGGAAANTIQKTGYAIALNSAAGVRNGGTVVADTTYAVPTGLNRMALGTRLGANNFLNGHIRSIRYVPVRAADFQLQALTAPPELLSLNIYDRFNDLVLDRAGQTIEVR
jgi:hypothetical protein